MAMISQELLVIILRGMKDFDEEEEKRINQIIDSTRYEAEIKRIKEEAERKLGEVIRRNYSTN